MPTIHDYLTSLGGSVEPLSADQLRSATAAWVATYGSPNVDSIKNSKRGAHKWKVFAQYRYAIAAHGLKALEQFLSIPLGAYTLFNDQEAWGFHCTGGRHPDFSDAGEDIYVVTAEWTMVFVNDYHLAFLAWSRPTSRPDPTMPHRPVA